LANLSGDPAQDYIGDGITENIITDLARFHDLFVIASNSTFAYKGKAAKIQDICRELGVLYVLEGSAQKSGDRIRISAQLIEGATGRPFGPSVTTGGWRTCSRFRRKLPRKS
jgi:adenylate cyclase